MAPTMSDERFSSILDEHDESPSEAGASIQGAARSAAPLCARSDTELDDRDTVTAILLAQSAPPALQDSNLPPLSPSFGLSTWSAWHSPSPYQSHNTGPSRVAQDNQALWTSQGSSPSLVASRGSMDHSISSQHPSYIAKLSMEVLQEIFWYCLKWEIVTERGLIHPWPHNTMQPELGAWLNLQLVNRFWRDSALCLPSLWGSIGCSVAAEGCSDTVVTLDRIRAGLKRRRQKLFELLSYEIGTGPITEVSKELMDTLVGVLTRSKAVQVIIPGPLGADQRQSTSANLGVKASHLRVFSWKSSRGIDRALPSELRLPWSKLRDRDTPATGIKFELPWTQLVDLALQCPLSIYDCCDVLLLCGQLRTAVFDPVEVDKEYFGPIIHHQNLSSLKVSASMDLTPFFRKVLFPQLCHLDLRLARHRPDDLNISWNVIQTLVLHCDIPLEEAYRLFQQCHKVTKLEWHWQTDSLTNSPRPDGLSRLPLHLGQLVNLTINPNFDGNLVRPLVNALNSRMQQLRVIKLPCIPPCLNASTAGAALICTEITLTCPITVDKCLSILAMARALKQANFLICESSYGDGPTTSCINLHALSSLTITSSADLYSLFNAITLPQLTAMDLYYRLTSENSRCDHRSLFFLISQSASLKRLVLRGASFSEAEVTHLKAIASPLTKVVFN